jgi:hypothetical protein
MDNEEKDKPNFKPAGNPFLAAVGLGAKKEEPSQQQAVSKDVIVGDKPTTLVGTTAEQKTGNLNVPEPEQKVPEETLYEWQAPEFSYTQKPAGWYLAIFAFFIGLCVLAFFFISSPWQKYTTIGLLVVMAIATSVWANRKPKVSNYTVTNYGIMVDQKKYAFDDFRAFYEYMDYSQHSIDFVPGKRFGTLVSLPLATPAADEIVETVSHMVPEIEHKEDFLDKIIRRLRF